MSPPAGAFGHGVLDFLTRKPGGGLAQCVDGFAWLLHGDVDGGSHGFLQSLNSGKTVTNALRDFKLSGIALNPEQQKRYGEISARLSELASKFGNNVMDATLAWHKHITDKSQLAGLPESALALAADTAKSKDLEGWVFTLDFPSYLPIMTYADDRELRKETYTAFSTRASDQGPNAGEFDNSAIMSEELALRHELAQLLGFNNYAEKSLATKMAESPAQVFSFLEDLAAKSKPQAEQELKELQQYAEQQHGISELQAWVHFPGSFFSAE